MGGYPAWTTPNLGLSCSSTRPIYTWLQHLKHLKGLSVLHYSWAAIPHEQHSTWGFPALPLSPVTLIFSIQLYLMGLSVMHYSWAAIPHEQHSTWGFPALPLGPSTLLDHWFFTRPYHKEPEKYPVLVQFIIWFISLNYDDVFA